ncbi:DUF4352 domain-containing protein [Streptomyces sp. NPDC085524]|uniref:DUF4190 domain-containing protein n=1 Tax=Streptomyces sp. NPDC085524 TaxID=3365728 RepID=UPI0037CFE13A
MSTPPNPSDTPTEPAGTPIPEPAPAPGPSPEKTPETPPTTAPPEATPAAALSEEPRTAALSLQKPPASPHPEEPPTAGPSPAAPLSEETPAAGPSPEKTPAATPPEATPAAGPSLAKTPATTPSPEVTSAAGPSSAENPAAPPSPEQTPAAFPAAPAPAASAFAPPMPVPPAPPGPGFGAPTAPTAPTAPGAFPGNPWAQPGAGYGVPGYPAYPQPAPATSNGLAVSAAIVGGLGILIGLVPLLFWAGFLLGLVAVGLGIGAIVRAVKGAPQKTLSIVGTVLGVVALIASVGGLFLTGLVFEKAADRRAEQRQQRRDLDGLSPGRPPSTTPQPSKPSQVPGLTSPLPFGETFTYDNGLKVSLSAPKEYEPKGVVARERSENAIQITLTITNGSTEPYEVLFAMPNVRDEQGMTAETVYDGSGGVPKLIKGAIMPGQSAGGVVAFELPKGTKNITADISPGIGLTSVKYAGPVG